MSKPLPGADFAALHGYTLQQRAGDYSSATYFKCHPVSIDGLYLTVLENGEATLERVIGIVSCKIGPFSIPGNFVAFERQISALYKE